MALSSIGKVPEQWKNKSLARIEETYATQKAAIVKHAKLMEREAQLFAMLIRGDEQDRSDISTMKILSDQKVAMQTCRLVDWVKEITIDAVKIILCEAISFFAPLYREKRWLTDDQIQYIASHILSYYQLSLGIGEVMYLMNAGTQGRYGKIYEGLDAEDILQWIAKYLESQSGKLEEEHLDKVQKQAPVYDTVDDMIKSKFDKWNTKTPSHTSFFQPTSQQLDQQQKSLAKKVVKKK